MSMSYPLLLNMIFLCIKFFVHSSFNLNFKGKSMILIKCNLRRFSSSYISISRTFNAGSRSSTQRLHLADSWKCESSGEDEPLLFELQLWLGIPVDQSWRPCLDYLKYIISFGVLQIFPKRNWDPLCVASCLFVCLLLLFFCVCLSVCLFCIICADKGLLAAQSENQPTDSPGQVPETLVWFRQLSANANMAGTFKAPKKAQLIKTALPFNSLFSC